MSLISLRATDELSPREYIPTLNDLESRIKFARVELKREQAKCAVQRQKLVEAVAELSVAPLHERDLRARQCAALRKTLETYEATVSDLIAFEMDAQARMEERTTALLAAE